MATRMQQRRGTAAQWTAANPILAAGEIGFETDTSKFKMGNGSSTWSALQYFANAAELAAIIGGDMPALLNSLDELAQAINDDPQFYLTMGTALTNHQNDTTMIHGIVDTALLATTGDVATAAQGAATELAAHASDTTGIHGIADTSLLATTGNITTHNSTTTLVHGIADTALLATTADVTDAADAAANALSAHESDTTGVHGIADTSLLVTTSGLTAHNNDTTDVHGIADTAALATKAYADDAETDAITAAGTAADGKITTHNSATENVHGILDTSLLATTQDITDHNLLTTNVHGIDDTSLLVTQEDLSNAISGAEVDQSGLAGVGIDWNSVSNAFDIDSTVATKTYADTAVTDHNSETTNVHGIIDTAALATKTYADGAVSTAVAALTKSSVGLANVDNTSDANKPVSTATQTALDLKANLDAPTFTGTVSGITKTMVGLSDVDNTADSAKPVSTAQATAIATAKSEAIADATSQVNALLTGAPAALNTLDELAAALGDDANFASTVTTNLGLKAPLASPTFTGTVTVAAAGVAFTDGTQTKEGTPSRTPIIQKSAAYTLSALTERDSLIEVSAAAVITIPTDATLDYPIGTSIDVLQTGTGAVSIAPVSGTVTVNATPGLTLRTQWSSATLFKRAANTWVVYGDLK
jgi:hypothetical protein